MKLNRQIFHGVVLSLMLLGSSCGNSSAEEGIQGGPTAESPVPVKLEEVALQPFTETIQLTGVVKAYEDVVLSAEEGGVLRLWTAEKGQNVRKGDTLAFLSDDVVKPTYLAAAAAYNTAELSFQKQQSVYREQAISELQFKTSQYNRDAANAQADLARARWIRTRIISPISGVLDDRLADEGEFAPPAVPIAHVVNLDRVKLLVNIPERYAGSIRLGTPVSFTVTSFDDKTFRGAITFVGSVISPDNRTFPVEVHLRNPGRNLKPEMIAKVRVEQSVPRKVILVGENVIQQVDQGKYVVYVARSGIAERRDVRLGAREENRIVILDGLRPGDQLIVSGFQNITQGQKLEVVK
jgi:membrane fusion protein (multidrug efflux system)